MNVRGSLFKLTVYNAATCWSWSSKSFLENAFPFLVPILRHRILRPVAVSGAACCRGLTCSPGIGGSPCAATHGHSHHSSKLHLRCTKNPLVVSKARPKVRTFGLSPASALSASSNTPVLTLKEEVALLARDEQCNFLEGPSLLRSRFWGGAGHKFIEIVTPTKIGVLLSSFFGS